MKKVLAIAALFILCASMSVIQKKKKVIFFGDSITQQGANKGGYIDLIQNTINQGNLQDQYELIGAGIGGNKVYDLYLRLDDDVLAKKPDVVFIYIGVNDVWHKTSYGTGTDQDKFEKFYQALIRKIQAIGARVIVCTPAVIGEKKNGENNQDSDLDKYSASIRKVANEFKVPVIDLRKAFTQYDKDNNPQDTSKGILTVDGVHLNDKGNALVADKMWGELSK
ncbi:SGNH/GDSL hydrolase family protein [Pinibacter aurantiacus]|uniref:G-D-S-L family lipolytic protein n=1 Tax=Pinibacter aurantiacus TaxID=2851599 RepID=A0A9E2S8D0_9BACT|nr:GDSL-type esterase/lipase family protein [Pinibacter aurantiacus]MBV4358418.1 G-D-S-L family lipolytic protein [Pinibacter aurantiacus]